MRRDLDAPAGRVLRRRRSLITPLEAAALAVRWAAVACIVAVWVGVALIVGR